MDAPAGAQPRWPAEAAAGTPWAPPAQTPPAQAPPPPEAAAAPPPGEWAAAAETDYAMDDGAREEFPAAGGWPEGHPMAQGDWPAP